MNTPSFIATFFRSFKLIAASWGLVLLLGSFNLGHINGVVLWLRTVMSLLWQMAFWSTFVAVYIIYFIILVKRRRSLKK